MKQFKKIIAIGAHFDDIEINCGGTLAKAIKLKSQVMMLVLGNGHFTHYTGKIIRSQTDALREGKKAALCLGVSIQNLVCLNFPEKNIPYNSDSVEKVEKVLNQFKPDLIITHWADDTHQDHINTSKTVISAARYFNSVFMWEPIFPSGRTAISSFHPQIYVDTTDVFKQKIKALQCHRTQIKKFNTRAIDWIEGISARARYRGFEIKCKYAEAFQPIRLQM